LSQAQVKLSELSQAKINSNLDFGLAWLSS